MLEQSLARTIRRANVEHEARALTQLVLGILFTLLIFGGIFVMTLFVIPWAWFTGKARLIAGGLSALLLLVAFWSAWRRVDPLQNLADFPEPNPLMASATFAATGIPISSPRGFSAGLASLMIAGPLNMLESFASWRARIRIDRPTLYAATDALARAADGIDIESITDPAPTTLLRRLRLVKLQQLPGTVGRIVLTERGRALLAEAGRIAL